VTRDYIWILLLCGLTLRRFVSLDIKYVPISCLIDFGVNITFSFFFKEKALLSSNNKRPQYFNPLQNRYISYVQINIFLIKAALKKYRNFAMQILFPLEHNFECMFHESIRVMPLGYAIMFFFLFSSF